MPISLNKEDYVRAYKPAHIADEVIASVKATMPSIEVIKSKAEMIVPPQTEVIEQSSAVDSSCAYYNERLQEMSIKQLAKEFNSIKWVFAVNNPIVREDKHWQKIYYHQYYEMDDMSPIIMDLMLLASLPILWACTVGIIDIISLLSDYSTDSFPSFSITMGIVEAVLAAVVLPKLVRDSIFYLRHSDNSALKPRLCFKKWLKHKVNVGDRDTLIKLLNDSYKAERENEWNWEHPSDNNMLTNSEL